MKKQLLFILILLMAVLSACSGKSDDSSSDKKDTTKKDTSEKVELTVSAAVSLTDALEEMQKDFEKEHNVSMKFNLGSSGTLAQQIQQGAPADVFISANQEWMDKLEESKDIRKSTRTDVTGNSIVLVAKKGEKPAVTKIKDITPKTAGQIAIGNPDSVPAGEYTKETLEHLKKWDALKDNFIMGKDVRQVLTYTETGNAEIGFVYSSDAKISDKVDILDTADKSWHESITYPAAVTSDTKHQKQAKAFVDYLESDKGQEILKKYGFEK